MTAALYGVLTGQVYSLQVDRDGHVICATFAYDTASFYKEGDPLFLTANPYGSGFILANRPTEGGRLIGRVTRAPMREEPSLSFELTLG